MWLLQKAHIRLIAAENRELGRHDPLGVPYPSRVFSKNREAAPFSSPSAL